MGTGWRRAFCTTVTGDPKDRTLEKQQVRSLSPSPIPRKCTRLGFLSGGGFGSNSTTPRTSAVESHHHHHHPASSPSLLRCRTTPKPSPSAASPGDISAQSPKLQCKTSIFSKTPKSLPGSNSSSPRSPLKLSLFKNSFKFRSTCGVCFHSVKTGRGTAVYTAECGHAFHFSCIADHVRKRGALVCPICNAFWNDVPLLSVHTNLHNHQQQPSGDEEPEPGTPRTMVKVVDRKMIESPSTIKVGSDMPAKRESPISAVSPKVAAARSRPSYDDDELLVSPAASRARFVPVSEAVDENNSEEEEEEEEEEFQGFFANSTPSRSSIYSDDAQANDRNSRQVDVRFLPQSALVSLGKSSATHVVSLRVKAPPPPLRAACKESDPAPPRRAPIDLVAVLDVSGSMTGAKLQMLKRAVRLVISSLGSADRLSIVAFSAAPKRLMPLRRMTAQGQRAARRIVDRLACDRGKSVGDALRKAAKVLEDRRERNPVASIILLSDGHDEPVQNDGENRKQASSHTSSTRFAHVEIPVHASGFSKSDSGGYGRGREPSEDAFAKCIGGLLSVVLQDLTIKLGFASGSDAAEITAVYSCNNGRPVFLGSGSVRLGDLYAEEERELLVELSVPTSTVGSHHVMTVRCGYRDPASQAPMNGPDRALVVPRLHAVRSSDPRIERLRNLFLTTRAVAESRRLVECGGDYNSAYQMLESTRVLLMQARSASAEEFVRELEAELADIYWRRRQELETQQVIQRRRVSGNGSGRQMNTMMVDANGEPLTPTSAWRAAEKVASMKKSSGRRVNDLHGFENARF